MTRGAFITFEGPEGGGKSTHMAALADRLRAAGLAVLSTREPGGTPLGEALRNVLQHDAGGEPPVPTAETLLFFASRAQLVARVVAPALEAGTWVLCDRFGDSTLAYQGYGRGLPLEELARIQSFATGGLEPDLTVLLDLPVAAGRRRLATRNGSAAAGDRFEREAAAFHERLRAGYLSLAAAHPARFAVVDSDRDRTAVAADVWTVVSRRLGARLPPAGRPTP